MNFSTFLLLTALQLTDFSGSTAPDPEAELHPPPRTPAEVQEGDDDELRIYDEVEVRDRADDMIGIADSANEGSTGRDDLANRPILRPGDLIETAPGVVATQHSGGGKANQYFVRGFNLDHGTDFSVYVAGVPVNTPSHGHGQGYADLSFLIPELVDRVRYRKGPYYADVGEFSAAGTVAMDIVDRLDENQVTLTGGSWDLGRALWIGGTDLGGDAEDGSGRIVAGIEAFRENGPWTRRQEYEGFKGLLRYSTGTAQKGHSITLMGYSADWLSTDQVPRRAVESGQIGRFDLLDPGPRGNTDRFSLSAKIHRGGDSSWTHANAFLLFYDFGLISNFTYFLEDPVNGDQFEQADQRLAMGFDVHQARLLNWGSRRVEFGYGFEARFDDIENGLFRTRDLDRLSTVRRDDIRQGHAGVWTDALIRWHDKVRTRIGVRGDLFQADVESDLPINSGSETDTLISPKLSFTFGPWRSTEFYLNLGYGHHSNDARGAVIVLDPVSGEQVDPVDPLVRAKGADIGFRTSLVSGLRTTVSLFVLELDSELLFVGDGGATEAGRPSRRQGIEFTNFYRFNPKVSMDLDITWTEAEFTDFAPEGDDIPGAIGTTIAAGLVLEDLGPWNAVLRWRYFGDIPLIEDGSVEWKSTSVVNGRIGYGFENGLDLNLEIFNLLDTEDSDVEYFYASRLPGEPEEGIEDVHFHPMESRSFRLSLTWRY